MKPGDRGHAFNCHRALFLFFILAVPHSSRIIAASRTPPWPLQDGDVRVGVFPEGEKVLKVCRWASFEDSIATCRISREPAADIARSISRSLDPCSPRALASSAASLCLHAATPPNNGPRKGAVSNHAFQALGCSCAPAECAPAHRGAQSYSATYCTSMVCRCKSQKRDP